MARKTSLLTITEDGRDKDKVFLLTEMPATQAERWAIRVFLAAAKNGLEIPDNIKQLGIIGLAQYGLQLLAQVPPDEAFLLMDEMMGCVQVRPSADVVRDLVEDDIEEIKTRFKIRTEVFKLHVDFINGAVLSTLGQAPTQGQARS